MVGCRKSEIGSAYLIMCRSLKSIKRQLLKFQEKFLGVERDFLISHRKLKQTIRKKIDNIAQLKLKISVHQKIS